MLLEKISDELKAALKGNDSFKVSILRLLLSGLKNKEIELRGVREITDDDVVSVVKKMVKTHEESITAFKSGGRLDLAEKEEKELQILKYYCPEALPESTIKAAVAEVLADPAVRDFGAAMKAVMARLKGQADGAVVARMVKEHLASSSSQ